MYNRFMGNVYRLRLNAVISFIALLSLTHTSCNDNGGDFSISGTLDNGTGKMLYLYEMSTYDLIPHDSAIIGPDGKFGFTGGIDQIRFMSLRENELNYLVVIVSPGEDIEITGNFNNLQQPAGIKGSPESALAAELNGKMHTTIMQMDSLGRTYRDALNTPGTDIEALRTEIRQEFEEISESQRQFTIDFIMRNPSSLASLMALYQQTDPSSFVLGREEDFKYYSLVDSMLIRKHPDLEYTLTLNENVREMKQQVELRRLRDSRLAAGSVAPEISLPDPQGDTISLSSLRGNYVLLDFWAAWCGPCREENPYLVEAYNNYSNRGFDIYQVSLDRTREAWLRGLEEDGLHHWNHVSDLQFWSSAVVPLYNIDGIPANFLLDPEGRIIARNLRGDQLGQTLSEIFN